MQKLKAEELVKNDAIDPLVLSKIINQTITLLEGGRVIKTYLELSEFRLYTPDNYTVLANTLTKEYIEDEYQKLVDNDNLEEVSGVTVEIPIKAEFREEEMQYIIKAKGSEYLSILKLVDTLLKENLFSEGFIFPTISLSGELRLVLEL